MYYMMRRRNNVGTVLTLEEPDDLDLQLFLQRFDIAKDSETGSITHLNDNDPFSENQPQSLDMPSTPSPTLDKTRMRHATRSQSRVTSLTKSPSPSPSKSVSIEASQSKSPISQGHTPTQDRDLNDFLDAFDSIGSPLSEDEKLSASPSDAMKLSESLSRLYSQPREEAEGGKDAIVAEMEDDEDAMKVDEPAELLVTSRSEDATPIQANTSGTSAQVVSPKSETAIDVADVHMKDSEDDAGVGSEEMDSGSIERPVPLPPSQPAVLPTSDEPVKSSIPFMHLGPSSPLQPAPTPRPPVIILAPSTSSTDATSFTFDETPFVGPEQPKPPSSPVIHRHQYNPNYVLPPLKSLPQEKEDSFPMGINKWAATLNANPVWKRVSRPSKCLSSREWAVAMTELKLIRTFDRIESLKDGGRWSFRQPKKQRGVGGLVKTHWDYLMDEMKWMRIDFREERRWKMALAYNLAGAVMEWHAAGSLEERKSDEMQDIQQDDEQIPPETTISQETVPNKQTPSVLLGVDYGSDEEEEEDEEDSLLEDALGAPSQEEPRVDQEALVKPKTEESEDASALRFNDSTQADTQAINDSVDQLMADPEEKDTKEGVIGLKSTSKDPTLAAKASSNSSSNNGDSDTPNTSTKSSLKQVYAPLRERILGSEIDKLFLDMDDFHITQPSKPQDVEHQDPIVLDLPPADLSSIFPELHPLGLLDTAPPQAPVVDGKKKGEKRSDRDDPNKRIEDTTYTKLFPVGQFMYNKPTLIGPLQPSKTWNDGKWLPLDETPIYVEYEGPTRPSEDMTSEIFDNRLSNSAILAQQQLMFAAARERDKDRKRPTEHQWSVNDDTLLKTLIDRYPYNWQLISESFNATRVTTLTDKRTARDCFERWREKWAPEVRRHPELPPQPAAPPAQEENAVASTSQMTTRGVKRLASSMAPTSPNTSGGSEPKKRRRHILLQETIRKSVKKKAEFQQKMLGTQRKPSTIHETHGPFNNMRHFSPAELSRMKAEKDAKTTHEIQLRKRQEEVTRAALQARLTPAQQQSLVQQQLLLQQQQQQQTPQGATTAQPQTQTATQGQTQQNGQQTTQPAQPQVQTVAVAQPAAQQAQVANIAQRSQNALLVNQALGAPRLTPQQLLQLQQQVRPGSQPAQAGQVAAHQLAQQGQILVPSLNGSSAALNGAHLTASFVNRDSTSSPAHVSPPRKSATPTSVSSPRITADQAQHGQVQIGVPNAQVAGNLLSRPASNMSYYSAIPGLTPEQLNVLRFMLMFMLHCWFLVFDYAHLASRRLLSSLEIKFDQSIYKRTEAVITTCFDFSSPMAVTVANNIEVTLMLMQTQVFPTSVLFSLIAAGRMMGMNR
ncbi:Chromatin modification-related protein EAF1 [Leucoagaricus sp. SymC.cos]|nr:Chromatin modification-related protein EAF1 [Leucoagaricus sp. SymC.cos]